MPAELGRPITHSSVDHLLISGDNFLTAHATAYDRLVIGVAAFHPSRVEPSVLVVQRSAHEEFLPNVWELPGGHVEATDATIIDAVVRETLEETGLVVTHVLGQFEDFIYTVQRTDGAGASVTKSTLQLNVVVHVAVDEYGQEPMVKLNPEEHQKYVWVSETELKEYDMTEGMGKVVSDALRWGREHAPELLEASNATSKQSI